MALPPLLLLQDIALTFGGSPLIESAELSVSPGERACLVGRNGSGKSTLLKIAAGLVEADRGKRFVQPGATVRYLAQEPDLSAYPTTLAFVEAGLGPGDDLAALYERTRGANFGAEVKRRIMLGTYVLSAGYYEAYYLKAQQVRTLIRRDYDAAFAADVHAIAMPTCPTPAFRLGERAEDPLQMYLADVFTVSANLTGLPAISVPCGFSPDRLPIGLQLTGRAFDEAGLCHRAADAG